MRLLGFVLPGSVAFAHFGSTHVFLISFVVGGTRGRFLCAGLLPEARYARAGLMPEARYARAVLCVDGGELGRHWI